MVKKQPFRIHTFSRGETMTIIEIEDYNGSTIGFFRIKGTKKEDIVTDLNGFVLADVESDYLLNTDEPLLRLQREVKE